MIPPFHEQNVMMKRRISLLGALWIVILACSISPRTDVFETDTFSFRIPEDWRWGSGDTQIFGSAFQQIVGIRDPHGLFPSANFTVLSSPLNDEADLETRFLQIYAENGFLAETQQQEVVVDGFPGYEIRYTNNVGEALFLYQDIWMEKDAVIYVLSFSCLNNSKENFTSIFDQIVGSFRFKDQ
jgi:hypothetical protein